MHGRSLVSLDCKGRFRARLRKCIGKYVKRINKEKDEEFKCKTVGKYRILKIPQNSYGMLSFFINICLYNSFCTELYFSELRSNVVYHKQY